MFVATGWVYILLLGIGLFLLSVSALLVFSIGFFYSFPNFWIGMLVVFPCVLLIVSLIERCK